jgi:type IV secretory pathway TraG/TraD family ATPase VirD4
MSFRDSYQQRRASHGMPGGGNGSSSGSSNIIGGGKPDGFYAGCYRDPDTGARGPEIWLPWLDPVLIVGRNRVGKDTGIIVPNALMNSTAITTVFQDTRLEVAAIAAAHCRERRRTWVANPFNEPELIDVYPDLLSDRVNLLKARELDPDHPLAFEHLCELTEAIIPRSENEHNPFFPLGAQALWAAFNRGELRAAKDEGRDPSLLNVRMQATEAEQFDPATREPITGVRAYARRVIDEGSDPQSASMLGPFAGGQSDGLRDVVATLGAHTRWCLSPAIIEDEKNPQIDLASLGEVPTSLFYGVPHSLVKPFSAYLRLFTTALLRPLFAPHKIPVRIFLNEFYAMGRVPAIESAIGLVAGSSIQLVIVVQSLSFLKQLYGDAFEGFFGQAGAVILVGSPADKFTATYLADHAGEMMMRQPNAGRNLNPGGAGWSWGDGYARRQYLMPQDLRNINHGEGFIWLAGLNDPLPAMFPPYFNDPLRPELARRARANPYYHG